jgi:homopolymeric O-antigen transport system permease protein
LNLRLLVELTKRDFTERYSGSVLGVFWTFIWPMVNIFVYTVIFSQVMGARLQGSSSTYSYGIYLVAGILPWTAFANTVSRSATVLVDKKHIISKIRVNLTSLPLYVVMSESITFLITLTIYLLFLTATGAPVHKTVFLLPAVYLVQQIFAFSLGFLISIFHVFIRDLKEVTGIILQIWFWFTPIVYVYDILPDFAKKLVVFNPAFLFIKSYQDIFALNRAPDFYNLLLITILAHALLLAGYFLFKKLEKDIRDFI